MNKYYLLFFIFFSCSNPSHLEVAETTYKAIVWGDKEKAEENINPNLNDVDKLLFNNIITRYKKLQEKNGGPEFNIKFIEDSIVADTAYVTIQDYKNPFLKNGTFETSLTKIDGEWKLNFK